MKDLEVERILRQFKLSPEAEVVRHHAPERAVRHVSPRKKRSVAEPAAV